MPWFRRRNIAIFSSLTSHPFSGFFGFDMSVYDDAKKKKQKMVAST
jgi:hypothetical protein